MAAASYNAVYSISAGSEGPRTGEITSVTIQKLLRMEGCRDVSINGGEGKPERKRKLERIDVDAEDVREVVSLNLCNNSFFFLQLNSFS